MAVKPTDCIREFVTVPDVAPDLLDKAGCRLLARDMLPDRIGKPLVRPVSSPSLGNLILWMLQYVRKISRILLPFVPPGADDDHWANL